jgi:uncharacterized protein
MKTKILLLLLFVSCSNLFYQPTKRHFLDPKQLNLVYDEVNFKSLNGTDLHGWFFKAKTKKVKGTIIQFHGNAQNISTHFYSLVWLIDEGYNLFTFDYEGYGKSQGEASQSKVNQDALAALQKGMSLSEVHGKGKVVVYGQSLGGAVLLRSLADYPEASKVDVLVVDSTFYSYKATAFHALTSRWFLVPFSPLAYVLVSDAYAPEPILKKIHTPILVIVGQKDPVIPQKFGKKIFKKVGSSKKWLWKLPEGQHIDAFHHAGGRYRKDFTEFLDSVGPR